MGAKYIATVPFSKIKKIELYMNTGRKTMAAIKAATGCTYIMNAGIFNMSTFKPYCNIKSNGKVWYNPNYKEYGMAWNTNDISMQLLPAAAYANYIGCVCLLRQSVKKTVTDGGDMGGVRGRTAIAIKGQNLVLYCSKDGSSYAKKPSALRDELYALGCTDALMLDGGGSSQCNFNGNVISAARIVQNLILVYTSNSTTTVVTKPASGTTVPAYTECPYTVPANNTTVKYGMSGSTVKWVQWQLVYRFGYKLTIDGSFGPSTKAAVVAFQRAHGLVGDGIVGNLTRWKLEA